MENEIPDVPGVYIVAYMGRVIYVGMAKSIGSRIRGHATDAWKDAEHLGKWLLLNHDHVNIRLDALVQPDGADKSWRRQAEAQCIRKFSPLFNNLLNH